MLPLADQSLYVGQREGELFWQSVYGHYDARGWGYAHFDVDQVGGNDDW